MRVLVVASHSGGHIFPAIAFCQGLRDKDRDVEINFVTTDGQLERKILKSDFNPIFFKRRKITVLTSYNLLRLFFRAQALINTLRPNLIVGFGGYLSIPFIICACFRRIPNFIHEQNMKLGLSNCLLANFSNKIIFSFSNKQISDKLKNKALFFGNPLRKEIRLLDKREARKFFDLDTERFTVLVMGGSQGSFKINTQILEVLRDKSFSNIQVIHIAGALDYERVRQEYKNINIKYKVFPFIERMDCAFSACDFVLSRAGATIMAEIAALRVPSILIPYPYAKLHQLDNARFLVEKNAAILIEDKSLCETILKEKITDLKNNPDKLKQMSQVLDIINVPDARNKIAEIAFNLTK